MSLQATCCATLVDEWVRAGVRHAVVSPGSRSTPLALALTERDELAVHVVLDERSAAFTALGIGKVTGVPAVLLCTSGTAAANHHPAVVEADLSSLPMLVVTADRPPGLHDVGAPQTIRQVGLFGASTRWTLDLDPLAVEQGAWRSLASRAVADARTGPVHVNLRLREPLLEAADDLPAGRPDGAPWHAVDVAEPRWEPDDDMLAAVEGRSVLVVAGIGADEGGTGWLGRSPWPVLADPLSGMRRTGSIAAFDAIVRTLDDRSALTPEVVLHLGAPPASKVLGQWLRATGARHVLVGGASGRWPDPDRLAHLHLTASPASVAAALAVLTTPPPAFLDGWRDAEAAAQTAIDYAIGRHPEITEPAVARAVTRSQREGDVLVVSSSMPIRDVEWFGHPAQGGRVLANRGANGIDGVTSTAIGVALADPTRPVTCLIGDLALLHDASALTGLADRVCSLTVVVVDNRGGGIFSFLPQAEALDRSRFEQLFGTPQPADLAVLCAAHGIPVVAIDRAADLSAALDSTRTMAGVRVVLVRTDRATNVIVHRELHAAVTEALTS